MIGTSFLRSICYKFMQRTLSMNHTLIPKCRLICHTQSPMATLNQPPHTTTQKSHKPLNQFLNPLPPLSSPRYHQNSAPRQAQIRHSMVSHSSEPAITNLSGPPWQPSSCIVPPLREGSRRSVMVRQRSPARGIRCKRIGNDQQVTSP